MTLGQIDNFVSQVMFNGKEIIETINVTGGEPLVHPNLEEIMIRLEILKKYDYVKAITINSNKIIESPDILQNYIINYSLPEDKPKVHNVVFLHPNDFFGVIENPKKPQTFEKCNHYRKHTIVVNYQGCSICCAGDAYIRLFGFEDLILNYLPKSLEEFPIKEMNKICLHCPFGTKDLVPPLEKDVGCPISDIYIEEANKNKLGRKISKRFPEL
jgi:hypothetical protein